MKSSILNNTEQKLLNGFALALSGITENLTGINPSEILDIKWFTYDEIMNMGDKLRSNDLITEAITAVEKNELLDIGIIKMIK